MRKVSSIRQASCIVAVDDSANFQSTPGVLIHIDRGSPDPEAILDTVPEWTIQFNGCSDKMEMDSNQGLEPSQQSKDDVEISRDDEDLESQEQTQTQALTKVEEEIDDDNPQPVETKETVNESKTEEVGSDSGKDPVSNQVMERMSIVGPGKLDEPVYAVLCGVHLEEDDKNKLMTADKDSENILATSKIFKVTNPSTTIGRLHGKACTNGDFIGLGKQKNLSRNHCRIYFRDKVGGTIDKSDSSETGWTYNEKSVAGTKVINAGDIDSFFYDDDGNYQGCFAIEVVGKNKIMVDHREVANSEAALLKHGSAIQIGMWYLYFLLPNAGDSVSVDNENDEKDAIFIDVPNPECTIDATTNSRKRKCPATISSSQKQMKGASTNSSVAGNMSVVSSSSRQALSIQLESLELKDLLDKFSESYKDNQWTRKEQMIGTTIALHAARMAAQSPEVMEIVEKEGGVNRMDVIKWIEQHPTFGTSLAIKI